MSEARQELRFATLASGARLAWASIGRGPALLRVAHWMTHVGHDLRSPIWKPWLERLGESMRLVRYDARGFGLSEGDGGPLDVDAAVEEIDAVAGSARLERFALLGMSGGAAPAIAFAARHPARVSALVIHGGYARGVLMRSPTPEQARFFEASVELIEVGWGARNPAVQQLFTTRMIPDATPEQARAFNEQQRLSCPAARAAQLMRTTAVVDVRALLPAVRCPTLVLHSEGDAIVPVDEGRLVAAAIPDARFEPLASNNHIPMAHEPAFERFREAIVAFVRDAQRAAAGAAEAGGVEFTARERELLELVGRGLDNLQVAAHLGIAQKTVRNALSRLYAKLGVEGRTQAIVRARGLGFGG